MRRVVGMLALIGLGVLLGFVVRLLWPREDTTAVYRPPLTDPATSTASAERTAA
jgi:hypothetical protein